jgi:hypothetical protein
MGDISNERMREIIEQAKDAAMIHDFTLCGMGLGPRVGFSNEVYRSTLTALISVEIGKHALVSQESIAPD